jgi:peptide-methionine (R)-S-oxide reductase
LVLFGDEKERKLDLNIKFKFSLVAIISVIKKFKTIFNFQTLMLKVEVMNTTLKFIFTLLIFSSCNAQEENIITTKSSKIGNQMKYNVLTDQEKNVILNKATDRPFTGDYYKKTDNGIYLCRQCNNPLYTSEDKFDSHCGWPSFDQEIKGSVSRVPDADGQRIEIICNNCKGHLGHVFEGEGFTKKNTRHCVNTSSLKFFPASKTEKLPEVIK